MITNTFDQGYIKNQVSIKEFPEDVHHKIEAKFSVDLQVFLASCIKDGRDKVTIS